MAVSLTHTTVAVGVEAGNGEIGKDEWNEAHTLTLATGKLLGRTTAGDGAVEEIAITDFVAVAGDTMTGTLTMDAGSNIDLSNTTNANQFGVLTKGGTRFIHDFNYGNNGTVTTSGSNTFVGNSAGNLTLGSTATQTYHSSFLTGIGRQALSSLTAGGANTAVGCNAGYLITTGSNNAALGDYALDACTTGSLNTAIGSVSLSSVTTGGYNTAIGAFSGQRITTGGYNTCIGIGAGSYVTAASNCVYVGYNAANATTTGASNTVVGNAAFVSNTVGGYSTVIGANAAGSSINADYLTVIGRQAIYLAGANITAGSFVVGRLYEITSAGTTDFTAIGAANNSVGTQFTATGTGSGTGTAITKFDYCLGIGSNVLPDLIGGNSNIGIGYSAGSGLVYGTGNTIIGNSVSASSSATNNILIGSGGTVRIQFDGSDWWFSGSIGYATGQGGTVTQATSRTTGVTLNKNCGAITLVSAAGSTSWQSFTVTNSEVAATDTVIVNQKSGTDLYMIHVTNVAAGSFQITYATTGGTTTEQPVFNFSVLKAVAA